MNTMQAYQDFAIDIARYAGKVMRDYFVRAEKGVEFKPDESPVTQADKQINAYLIERVAEAWPDHGVSGEEASTMTAAHRDVWVCDPIDGTIPFIIGIPTAMFSLALVRDGVPILGVAYDPFGDRLFTAIAGEGAYLNGQRIHVSDRDLPHRAIIAGPSHSNGVRAAAALYDELQDQGGYITLFPGNVYKCTLIAEGRIDGRIFGGPYAHDIAAVKVIVEEAGGRVTDLTGNDQRYNGRITGAIISNGHIHDQLVNAVHGFGGAEAVMKA